MKILMLISVVGMLAACGRAKFQGVEQKTCSIENNQIVCPDGTTAPLPQDGRDGTDGEDAVLYSEVKVAPGKCTQVASGVFVENIRNGDVFDVYYNDKCQDRLGEYCDNVEPSEGSVGGQLGDNRPGGAEVCWAMHRQVSGERSSNGNLLIRVLEFTK